MLMANCPDSPTGAHHWLVEPPAGHLSWGQCKWCSAEQEFENSRDFGTDKLHREKMIAASAERRERARSRVLGKD